MALDRASGEPDKGKTAVNLCREVSKGGYKIVTTEELKGQINNREAILIIETMPLEESFKKNHISDAVQIEFPKEELTQRGDKTKAAFKKFLGPDKNKKFVFYCGFTKCGRSRNGAFER